MSCFQQEQPGSSPGHPTPRLSRLRHSCGTIAVYAAVGAKEKTIALLQRLYRDRTGSLSLLGIKVSARYDFIRDDPRFIDLLELIGLAD